MNIAGHEKNEIKSKIKNGKKGHRQLAPNKTTALSLSKASGGWITIPESHLLSALASVSLTQAHYDHCNSICLHGQTYFDVPFRRSNLETGYHYIHITF